MPKKHMWAAAYTDHILTLGNSTNNRGESLHRQVKRFLQKRDSLHKCIFKVYRWNVKVSRRIEIEAEVAATRRYTYHVSASLEHLLRHLTKFAATRVLYQLKKVRNLYVSLATPNYMFINDGSKSYEVDLTSGECTCPTYIKCRYPCQHMLLAHLRDSNFTIDIMLRHCRRWMHSYNLCVPINSATPCFKPSKQLLQKMINTQRNGRLIFQKFGESFAMRAFTKLENYTKRILRR
uniref:SWIM-type domain-containing protein n=1 Tax=Schistosoma japonicum TaxID=6182 RepID=Q5BZY9_SCHJA|nr:unknown [Schistosoma japonicum]